MWPLRASDAPSHVLLGKLPPYSLEIQMICGLLMSAAVDTSLSAVCLACQLFCTPSTDMSGTAWSAFGILPHAIFGYEWPSHA